MTINEAITVFDLLMPNVFPFDQKKDELSRLDKRVFEDIYSKYADCPVERFEGYTTDTPPDTELLIPYPDDDLYVYRLAMQADYVNGDIARYNNSAGLFNARFEAFCNDYNRSHRVKKNTAMGDIV